MFRKSGKAIRVLAVISFVFSCVLALVVLIGCIVAADMYNEDMLITAGVLGAALLIYLGWVSNLMLAAYGELAEAAVEINESLKEIKKMKKAGAHAAAAAAPASAPAVQAPAGEWVCRNCGKRLQAGHRFCDSCGTPRS